MYCLMILSLLLASCESKEEEKQETSTVDEVKITETTAAKTTTSPSTKETVVSSSDKPVYGGVINLVLAGDQLEWDPVRNITGTATSLVFQHIWEGDWARGIAGGHGTGESDWAWANNDLFMLKTPVIAENVDWTIDPETQQGTIVYQIRQGIHYQQMNTPAGQLVKGRELTADDVVYVINRATTIGITGFLWRANAELRDVKAEKTGPWEVTVKVPVNNMRPALSRFGGGLYYYPPELVETYGDIMDWRNIVGSGPFMLTDVVTSSMQRLERNPSFWMTDPVGPGKGNELPYADEVKVHIIQDASSRYAGVRTGKIDQIVPLEWEDANQLMKTAPGIQYSIGDSWQGRGMPLMMRLDREPFSDIRVRQAMTMAINFQEILDGLYNGEGQIITYPFAYVKEYAGLHIGLEDDDFPEAVREYYSYNPEKARQLLAEAGYPDGFKVKLLLPSTATAEIEYYQVIHNMWSQVDIELEFDLREAGAVNNLRNSRTHEEMATFTTGPIAVFWTGNPVSGQSASNLSMINDPYINDLMAQVRLASWDDEVKAMQLFREISKYALEQAYAIPNVIGRYYCLWWPWLRNYSGETAVGYDITNWPTWVWVDSSLKRSMGY